MGISVEEEAKLTHVRTKLNPRSRGQLFLRAPDHSSSLFRTLFCCSGAAQFPQLPRSGHYFISGPKYLRGFRRSQARLQFWHRFSKPNAKSLVTIFGPDWCWKIFLFHVGKITTSSTNEHTSKRSLPSRYRLLPGSSIRRTAKTKWTLWGRALDETIINNSLAVAPSNLDFCDSSPHTWLTTRSTFHTVRLCRWVFLPVWKSVIFLNWHCAKNLKVPNNSDCQSKCSNLSAELNDRKERYTKQVGPKWGRKVKEREKRNLREKGNPTNFLIENKFIQIPWNASKILRDYGYEHLMWQTLFKTLITLLLFLISISRSQREQAKKKWKRTSTRSVISRKETVDCQAKQTFPKVLFAVLDD